METRKVDVVVIGSGPAGIAAATAAKRHGAERVALFERNPFLGGILLQCIHDGFGLHHYEKALTGPEYAARLIDDMEKEDIQSLIDSMIIGLDNKRRVTAVTQEGLEILDARAVILAMGCRERTRGAIQIPGSRPAGIYTAGVAQNLMNLHNLKVGRDVVILGSGDIGMIMARHVAIEAGMQPICVIEKLPYVGGLTRNRVQCLEDFDIPLHLSATIVDISGKDRLQAVIMSKVDERGVPIAGSEVKLDCDTLFLSVGLIPENELSKEAGVELDPLTGGAAVDDNFQTTASGIFACGNGLHIHDVADYAAFEGDFVGRRAAEFVNNDWVEERVKFPVAIGYGIRYALPQYISKSCKAVDIKFRVDKPCESVRIIIESAHERLYSKKFVKILPSEMQIVKLTSNNSFEGLKVYLEEEKNG